MPRAFDGACRWHCQRDDSRDAQIRKRVVLNVEVSATERHGTRAPLVMRRESGMPAAHPASLQRLRVDLPQRPARRILHAAEQSDGEGL